MKTISFKVSAADMQLISRIARRAVLMAKKFGVNYSLMDANMDITACHANGNQMNLAAFLAMDDTNFCHDAFGIRRHINRDTGELMDCFVPRCSL